jgi:hypothetical protein
VKSNFIRNHTGTALLLIVIIFQAQLLCFAKPEESFQYRYATFRLQRTYGEQGAVRFQVPDECFDIIYSPNARYHVIIGPVPQPNVNVVVRRRDDSTCWGKLADFPRAVMITDRFVVYGDFGPLNSFWTPGASGLSNMKFIRDNWTVYVRATKTGKLLWKANAMDDGQQVAITGDTVWFIRLTNPHALFAYKRRPSYALVARNITNGRILREFRIPQWQVDTMLHMTKSKYSSWDQFLYPLELIMTYVKRTGHELRIVLGSEDGCYLSYSRRPSLGLAITLHK